MASRRPLAPLDSQILVFEDAALAADLITAWKPSGEAALAADLITAWKHPWEAALAADLTTASQRIVLASGGHQAASLKIIGDSPLCEVGILQ